VRFGVDPRLTDEVKERIRQLRQEGMTVPAIMKQTELSKASVYRALAVQEVLMKSLILLVIVVSLAYLWFFRRRR
jgi:DNA invertase Pin-like site-specific DNA recombinase